MSLEFVIIPSKKNHEDGADDIVAMMRHNIKHIMNIEFDKNYDDSLNSRINKWKRKDFHVITVDEEYAENSYIKVRFYDKGSKPEKMTLLDFIDIVSSFEDDDDKKETADDETSCIIM